MSTIAGNRTKAESHLRIANERREDSCFRNTDSARDNVSPKKLSVRFAICFDCAREDLGAVTVCRSFGLFGRGIRSRERLPATTEATQKEIRVHCDH